MGATHDYMEPVAQYNAQKLFHHRHVYADVEEGSGTWGTVTASSSGASEVTYAVPMLQSDEHFGFTHDVHVPPADAETVQMASSTA